MVVLCLGVFFTALFHIFTPDPSSNHLPINHNSRIESLITKRRPKQHSAIRSKGIGLQSKNTSMNVERGSGEIERNHAMPKLKHKITKTESKSTTSTINYCGPSTSSSVSTKPTAEEAGIINHEESSQGNGNKHPNDSSATSSTLDEFDERWYKRDMHSGSASEESLLLQSDRIEMTWKDWLLEPQFYKV